MNNMRFEQLSLNPPQQLSTTAEPYRPSFLLVTDSHGRFFPPIFETHRYSLTTKAVSGLSWKNTFNPSLCAHSIVFSSSITSNLPNYKSILFLVGTNSIRNTKPSVIIDQIEHMIDLLRLNYPHFSNPAAIGIVTTFPCYKPSATFPSLLSLQLNRDEYHRLLHDLSLRKNFSVLSIPIEDVHLHTDRIHVHPAHRSIVWNSITQYFDEYDDSSYPSTSSRRRSRAAIARRNKNRHTKIRMRQCNYTITRYIDPTWPLSDLKNYLKHKGIAFARLPEIHHHQLRIQFNNRIRQQHADQVLSQHDFDADNYYNWKNS